ILSNNPTVGRDQLVTMVQQKKQESHGLLSDEGAIRLVAQQLSISSLPSTGFADQRISSVHAGLNNSTITGRVVMVGEIREFPRSDGSQGKVLRIKIEDSSGKITCVFWDAMADTVAREQLTYGSQVRLLHGYTKHGMAGEVEFHLGSRASIQILKRSESIDPNTTPASVPAVSFRASDELRVRLLKLQKSQSGNGPTWGLCSNESGLFIAKFWDNHAQDVLSLGEGSLVLIQNQWVTERNGMVYVNIGSKSSLTKESADLVADTPVTSIASLQAGPVLWTISGKVMERGEVREIETREGRRTRVSNINLEDDTARIRVSLWDSHAEKTESLRIGDHVRLTGIKVRENMNGEKEASTVFLTQLEKQ
ncbi:MAG TPA: OB-fold nucleic acid binding domain-containing protein, partial [Candidatus Dormibacteraeota bacterium]|nr:OB-fold nucleic acid binding domain-containing protein [Candidatus Dormibacteraeota bacterium]